MPFTPILIVEIFDVWVLTLWAHFPHPIILKYFLVAFNYVSKWIKAIPHYTNDHRVIVKFLKEYVVAWYSTPRAIISDKVHTFITMYLSISLRSMA